MVVCGDLGWLKEVWWWFRVTWWWFKLVWWWFRMVCGGLEVA